MSHGDAKTLLHGPETCPNPSLVAARARRNFLSFRDEVAGAEVLVHHLDPPRLARSFCTAIT
jgi:hypothetical protein